MRPWLQCGTFSYNTNPMGFFTSFIHNDALAAILAEGHNPEALQKLDSADLQALRQKLHGGEALGAYLIGRIVGGGRGVWAVGGQALLLLDPALQGAQRIEAGQVQSFEAERGRYGHTVRLRADGRSWSLYGVDRGLAELMHQALQAAGVSSRFDARPIHSPWWRTHADAGRAAECVGDARRRLAQV